jgi:hypothetical protein
MAKPLSFAPATETPSEAAARSFERTASSRRPPSLRLKFAIETAARITRIQIARA